MTEIIDEKHPFLDPLARPRRRTGPSNNLDFFPVEVNKRPLRRCCCAFRASACAARSSIVTGPPKPIALCASPSSASSASPTSGRATSSPAAGSYAGTGADFSREGLRAQLAAPVQGRASWPAAPTRRSPGQLSLFEQRGDTRRRRSIVRCRHAECGRSAVSGPPRKCEHGADPMPSPAKASTAPACRRPRGDSGGAARTSARQTRTARSDGSTPSSPECAFATAGMRRPAAGMTHQARTRIRSADGMGQDRRHDAEGVEASHAAARASSVERARMTWRSPTATTARSKGCSRAPVFAAYARHEDPSGIVRAERRPAAPARARWCVDIPTELRCSPCASSSGISRTCGPSRLRRREDRLAVRRSRMPAPWPTASSATPWRRTSPPPAARVPGHGSLRGRVHPLPGEQRACTMSPILPVAAAAASSAGRSTTSGTA